MHKMSTHFSSKLYDHCYILVLLFYTLLTYSACYAVPGVTNGSTEVVQCAEKEREALLQFKHGIHADHCGLLSSWGGSPDCCQWGGVRCNNDTGHVISLSLTGNITQSQGFRDYVSLNSCLNGILSDSLVELKHLKYLNLGFNDFQGQSIPKFIGSLANLEYLNLSHAGFSGVIPSEIGNLSRLTSLDLNSFPTLGLVLGSLSWLSHLRLLRNINLDGVDLSNTPNWFSIVNNLPFLETLSMDNCKLSPKLPSSLSYINSSSTLHSISLGGNNFNDTSIFQWLFNLTGIETSLTYLDLSYNQFSGGIPSFIWKLNSLLYLDLSYNNLSGQIPSEIWTIDTLSHLSLAGNRLEGPISNSLANLKHLATLDLSQNSVQFSRQALKSLGGLCRLQKLMLDGNNITYEFSEVIESLSPCAHKSLVFLSLSNNKVWGSVPNSISKFSSLESLSVDNTLLNGTIGEGIGRLARLQTLDLSRNRLNGIVSHDHFSDLSNLSVLWLSGNQLVLNLSDSWIPPFQLDALELGSCKIGPFFPKWLLTQRKLADLDISDAGIVDAIPKSFWTSMSSTMVYLNMSNNMIHGVLPNLSFQSLTVEIIDISSNKLSGAIPSFLRNNVNYLNLNNNKLSQGLLSFFCRGTETSLYFIDLSNNLFSEALPDCWSYFPDLVVLQLQNNNISGNLPPSIAAINGLQELNLGNNRLSGELPMSWANSTSLNVLDLGYNSLTGSIRPISGDGLVNLRVLSLKNNHFSMDIPSSLCQLTSVQILDLSSNHISGPLPKCLYNFTMMANKTNFPQPIRYYPGIDGVADLEWFMWKRKEHSFDVMLGLLQGIDISDNKLQGQIPAEISTLAGLVFLNLSQNNLSGAIPSKIGRLTSLQFLDLSRNRLSGQIPTSLASIASLEILDVSENNLSGEIPEGTQLQGFDASAYAGNPRLCGEPLRKCHVDQASPASQNDGRVAGHKKHDDDDDFLLGLYISVVLGFITGFWAVCGTITLKRTWRLVFFRFCDDLKDRVYVMVVVKVPRAWRRS